MIATWMAVLGQGPVQEPAETVLVLNIWEFIKAGGVLMIPIGLCSVVALAFALERYSRLRRRSVCPPVVDEALAALARGDAATAAQLCESNPSPATRILAAGLRRAGRSSTDVERAMEDQGRNELEKLRANIRPLNVIATVSPLLGLLGTVIGIQEAFHSVTKTGAGKAEHLAGGIEVALTTTISGMIVAIPVVVVASHLSGRVRRAMVWIDDKLKPAVDMIAARPRSIDAA